MGGGGVGRVTSRLLLTECEWSGEGGGSSSNGSGGDVCWGHDVCFPSHCLYP